MSQNECLCNHCSAPIVFESDQIGTSVPCPHCGLDTLLFRPSPPRLSRAGGNYWPRLKGILWILGIVATAMLAMVVLVGLVTALPKQTADALSSLLVGIPGMLFAIGLLLLVVMWALFPVLVYVYLKRISETLREIATKQR